MRPTASGESGPDRDASGSIELDGGRRRRPSRPRRKAGRRHPPTFALALGGGGARGLAHIPVIEALDDMQVRPVAIVGTSIGAAVGAAYAAGVSGKEMRRLVITFAHQRAETLARLIAARAAGLRGLFASPLPNPMLLDAEKLCAAFLPAQVPQEFAKLATPLTVVATDFHERCAVWLSAGPLRPAIAASMAVPGLLRPVVIDGRVLVDGGAVEPLPFEALRGKADVILGVDVSGGTKGHEGEIPDPWECLFSTMQITAHAILTEKLRHGAPDIVVRPNIGTFRMLDFFRASAILRAADPIGDEVKRKLAALLGV